jgi:hypothetical protein
VETHAGADLCRAMVASMVTLKRELAENQNNQG